MITYGYVYLLGLIVWAMLGHQLPFTLRGWQSTICGFVAIGVPCFLMACYGFSCSTGLTRGLWFALAIYILLSYLILLPVVIMAIRMQLREVESPESRPVSVNESRKMRLLGILLPAANIIGWYLTFGLTTG